MDASFLESDYPTPTFPVSQNGMEQTVLISRAHICVCLLILELFSNPLSHLRGIWSGTRVGMDYHGWVVC